LFKNKAHLTSKTLSKLGIRLETGGALFPSPRHPIRGLVGQFMPGLDAFIQLDYYQVTC